VIVYDYIKFYYMNLIDKQKILHGGSYYNSIGNMAPQRVVPHSVGVSQT